MSFSIYFFHFVVIFANELTLVNLLINHEFIHICQDFHLIDLNKNYLLTLQIILISKLLFFLTCRNLIVIFLFEENFHIQIIF
jgi:hypothetical protein